MTIGVGIFLSALIFLYLQTKDRWQWKKIIIKSFVGIVAISSLVGICALGVNYYQQKPKVMTELQGIHLGSKKEDILFTLGNPQKGSDQNFFLYENMKISFKKNKVSDIVYFCKRNYDYKELNGIHCGNGSDKILEKFKNNVEIKKVDRDPLFRSYIIKKYNCKYILIKNEVQVLVVEAPVIPTHEVADALPPAEKLTPEEEAELLALEAKFFNNSQRLYQNP